MPEPEPLSPLNSPLNGEPVGFRGADIFIEERPFVEKLTIRGRAHEASFVTRFAEVFDVAPPAPRRSVEAIAATIISVGPSEWLAVGPCPGSAVPRPASTRARLEAAAIVVVDVSCATTILRISGPGCVSTLRRLCALPLDRLTQGNVARTRMCRLAVLIHALGLAHFDLFVPRGYAGSLFEQLRDAAELRG